MVRVGPGIIRVQGRSLNNREYHACMHTGTLREVQEEEKAQRNRNKCSGNSGGLARACQGSERCSTLKLRTNSRTNNSKQSRVAQPDSIRPRDRQETTRVGRPKASSSTWTTGCVSTAPCIYGLPLNRRKAGMPGT